MVVEFGQETNTFSPDRIGFDRLAPQGYLKAENLIRDFRGTGTYLGGALAAAEAELDCVCLYVQGASGNVNPTSRIEGETFSKDVNVYGQELAKYLLEAQDSMTPCETGTVKVNSFALEAQCNHNEDDKYAQALQIRAYYQASGNDQTFRDMLAQANLNSIHHCNGIITNYQLGETDQIELTTLSIGPDIGFACFPYEMFDTEGMYIKENSPFDTTFIVGYCNGFFAYIPNNTGWENGGYERDITKFVQGTAEACAEELVEMLNGLNVN